MRRRLAPRGEASPVPGSIASLGKAHSARIAPGRPGGDPMKLRPFRTTRAARPILVAAVAAAAVLVPGALAAGTALASTGAAGDHDHRRGQLVSSTRIDTLPTRSDVDTQLTTDRFDPGTDRYGV